MYGKQNEIDKLRVENKNLHDLINRAMNVLGVNPKGYSPFSPAELFSLYVKRLETDANEKAERERIENIILDLKKRNWKPE